MHIAKAALKKANPLLFCEGVKGINLPIRSIALQISQHVPIDVLETIDSGLGHPLPGH